MKIDDKLSEIFEVEPISSGEVVNVNSSNEVVVGRKEEELQTDVSNVRTNLYGILNQGNTALEYALEVAKASEHPRAFEVVGGLLKHLADINHQLIDLHAKERKINGVEKEEAKTVTNNTLFVGSTNDLLKLIKEKKG